MKFTFTASIIGMAMSAVIPVGMANDAAASVAPSGPVWSPPAKLADQATQLSLGAGVGGQEAAVWLSADDGAAGTYRAMGTAWEAPRPISGASVGVPGDLVVDPAGRAVAAMGGALASRSANAAHWSTTDTGAPRFHDGGAELAVEGSGHTFGVIDWFVPLDPDDVAGGNAITRWWQGLQRSDGSWTLLANPPGGFVDIAAYGRTDLKLTDHYRGIGVSASVNHASWTIPALLLSTPSHGGGAASSSLAANAQGAAVAVAAFRDGVVGMAYKPAGRAWQTQQTVQGQVPLGPQPGTVSTVAGTVSPTGQATMIYVDAKSRVMTVRHPAAGSWTTPQALSGPLPAPYSLRVTDDGLGNTVAAWGTDTKGVNDVAQAAYRSSGSTWQSAVSLGTAQTHADFSTSPGRTGGVDIEPVKLVATRGRFTAAFRDGDGWDYSDLSVVSRLGGANRYDTAVAVSRGTFAPGVSAVYVATGRSFADGLAGGPSAARGDGPLLLVPGDKLPTNVAEEIARLRPAKIVVLGGTSAVSAAVETQLQALAPVDRVAGANRYGTAGALAREWTNPPTVYLASGQGFADALAGGGLAAAQSAPLLLTKPLELPEATTTALRQLAPQHVVILGGTSAISPAAQNDVAALLPDATVTRLAGHSRYDTSAAVLEAWPAHTDGLMLATGAEFADALAGTPAAAHLDVPLALTRSTCMPTSVRLTSSWADHFYLLGGPGALGTAATTTTCK